MHKNKNAKIKNTCIICDFDRSVGFGHYYRSLALYKELKFQKLRPFFLFNKKNKKFINPYVKDIKVEFFEKNLNKNTEEIIKFLKKKKVNLVIIDSYKLNYNFEKIIRNNFFAVSIDDKLNNHSTNVVFNSRLDQNLKEYENKSSRWYFGKDFVLFNRAQKKKVKSNYLKKILIHAGGADSYLKNYEFFYNIFSFLKNKKVKIDIICSNKKIKSKLTKDWSVFKKKKCEVNLINFDPKLRNNLKSYDLVIGPAGNITYESMSAGTMPLSFPLINDYRDSMMTWNLFGNFLHLSFDESKNKIIIKKVLNFIFDEFKNLIKNFNILTRNFSSGEKNIIKKIKKNILNKKNEYTNNLTERFKVKKAKYSDARLFLIGRNQKKVRLASSNPNRIILWPEHLNWWKNKKIKKFVLCKNNIPKGFHWVNKYYSSEINYHIVISGWFPFNENDKENLKYSKLILDHQTNFIKKNYKNSIWLININKKNSISLRMNSSKGFVKANNKFKKVAKKTFKINLLNFNVYQMKI